MSVCWHSISCFLTLIMMLLATKLNGQELFAQDYLYLYKTEMSVCLSICLSVMFGGKGVGGCLGRRGGCTGRRGQWGGGFL